MKTFTLIIVSLLASVANGQGYTIAPDGQGGFVQVETPASLQRFEQGVDDRAQARGPEGFGDAVRSAIRNRVRSGTLSRGRALSLRIKLLSPAFRAKAEGLFLLEFNAGGNESGSIPVDASGAIDRENIDWAGLTAFLEVFLEVLEQLAILLERFA